MDDDELIARLAGGDDGALRELFRRHAYALRGPRVRLTGEWRPSGQVGAPAGTAQAGMSNPGTLLTFWISHFRGRVPSSRISPITSST
jgi:hypothetical protein